MVKNCTITSKKSLKIVGLFHKICSTKLSDKQTLLLGLYFIALALYMCVFSSLPGNTQRGVLYPLYQLYPNQ